MKLGGMKLGEYRFIIQTSIEIKSITVREPEKWVHWLNEQIKNAVLDAYRNGEKMEELLGVSEGVMFVDQKVYMETDDANKEGKRA